MKPLILSAVFAALCAPTAHAITPARPAARAPKAGALKTTLTPHAVRALSAAPGVAVTRLSLSPSAILPTAPSPAASDEASLDAPTAQHVPAPSARASAAVAARPHGVESLAPETADLAGAALFDGAARARTPLLAAPDEHAAPRLSSFLRHAEPAARARSRHGRTPSPRAPKHSRRLIILPGALLSVLAALDVASAAAAAAFMAYFYFSSGLVGRPGAQTLTTAIALGASLGLTAAAVLGAVSALPAAALTLASWLPAAHSAVRAAQSTATGGVAGQEAGWIGMTLGPALLAVGGLWLFSGAVLAAHMLVSFMTAANALNWVAGGFHLWRTDWRIELARGLPALAAIAVALATGELIWLAIPFSLVGAVFAAGLGTALGAAVDALRARLSRRA